MQPPPPPGDTPQGADGQSAAGARLARQIERQPHEFTVIHGADYGIAAGIFALGVLADRAT